jgi:FKBP-type peptidyl-prolyl cis-trans isomerase 2
MKKEGAMRHVTALVLGLALALGTAYAAILPSDPSDRVAPNREAPEQGSITEGAKVTIAFKITTLDTHEIVTRLVSEYVAGDDRVTPAVQKELMGMKPGERKRVELPPEEAFGPYDEQKKVKLPREILPATAKTGVVYQTPQGEPFTVVALSDDTAIADFNHPLAGKHVLLDVLVVNVEPPS